MIKRAICKAKHIDGDAQKEKKEQSSDARRIPSGLEGARNRFEGPPSSRDKRLEF